MNGSASGAVDGVAPISSAVVGVTLLADMEDALSLLRTAVLLARNLRATLYLDLPGRDVVEVRCSPASCSTLLSELLESARGRLSELVSGPGPGLIVEANIIAASFVAAGTIMLRVRNAHSLPGDRES